MDEAIQIDDIKQYIQRRRAYLATRRDAAETPADKGRVIGMLQALADFEGMIRQLRVIPAAVVPAPPEALHVQITCDELASRWLSALDLPGVCLDNFRDDVRQNRVIARHPENKQGIILLGQLLRNRALVEAVLDHLRPRTPRAPANKSMEPARAGGNGSTCPFCGKTYKYAKALESHVAICPRKSTSR